MNGRWGDVDLRWKYTVVPIHAFSAMKRLTRVTVGKYTRDRNSKDEIESFEHRRCVTITLY